MVEDPPVVALEPAASGVTRAGEILRAATHARWPMYLRNVKQILRAADEGFDERRYGFSGLVEFVRACQKEGFVRLERDRRGGLRVFPGPALHQSSVPREEREPSNVQPQPLDVRPSEPVEEPTAAAEPEPPDVEPMPTVDPTAELLGTVKRKRVVRGSRMSSGSPAKKTAARKAATGQRSGRPKKAAAKKDDEGETGNAKGSGLGTT
jgi:hypothetical protein